MVVLPAGRRLSGLARVDCRAVAPWLFYFVDENVQFLVVPLEVFGVWLLNYWRCRMTFFVEASLFFFVRKKERRRLGEATASELGRLILLVGVQ